MQSLETLLSTPLERRFVRAREISCRLGISIPTLYHWEKTTDFPKRIRLGANSVAWRGSEVQHWIDQLSNGNGNGE